jgi:hypothetical protein
MHVQLNLHSCCAVLVRLANAKNRVESAHRSSRSTPSQFSEGLLQTLGYQSRHKVAKAPPRVCTRGGNYPPASAVQVAVTRTISSLISISLEFTRDSACVPSPAARGICNLCAQCTCLVQSKNGCELQDGSNLVALLAKFREQPSTINSNV